MTPDTVQPGPRATEEAATPRATGDESNPRATPPPSKSDRGLRALRHWVVWLLPLYAMALAVFEAKQRTVIWLVIGVAVVSLIALLYAHPLKRLATFVAVTVTGIPTLLRR